MKEPWLWWVWCVILARYLAIILYLYVVKLFLGNFGMLFRVLGCFNDG